MEENTVRIPSAPTPKSNTWLGAMFTAAALSWTGSLCVLITRHRTEEMLLAAGLVISLTMSVAAFALWVRHSLQATNSSDHKHLADAKSGQHAMTMAELREQRRHIDETSAAVVTQLQAMNNKLSKLANTPSYWDGFADALDVGGGGQVVNLRRPRTN